MYRFNALVRLSTGIVSLFTVYHLFKILPTIFKQKTNVELENEIARRLEAERKLDEANKDLEAFAYIASHDLQEPLRKMTTYTSRLYDTNRDKFDESSKVYVDKIMSSGTRMQTMIRDILTLSTITNEMELSTVDAGAAIKIALADLEIRILERQAIIEVKELPMVKGNEFYLSQLFMNLVGNAIKFSKGTPHIEIEGGVQNDKAVISVKDYGIGMDEQEANQIFIPFKRLQKKGEYEGSGIGLSICKKIVQLHSGEIKVKSKIGEGTTFIIELPKA
jgi:light-regulated signal transduction histidine kinase (bacteriophytochrome)